MPLWWEDGEGIQSLLKKGEQPAVNPMADSDVIGSQGRGSTTLRQRSTPTSLLSNSLCPLAKTLPLGMSSCSSRTTLQQMSPALSLVSSHPSGTIHSFWNAPCTIVTLDVSFYNVFSSTSPGPQDILVTFISLQPSAWQK